MKSFSPAIQKEMLDELQMIHDGWKLIEQGMIQYRRLTAWEKERLGFISDLLEKAKKEAGLLT
ncbi:MAG TPA: hypothetical protein ENI23_07305 [bacterium]|nr:hypothetical protein [bacterium]